VRSKPNFDLTSICTLMVSGPVFHSDSTSSLETLNTPAQRDTNRLMNASESEVSDTASIFC